MTETNLSYELIQQWHQLHIAGAISHDEFLEKKGELLGLKQENTSGVLNLSGDPSEFDYLPDNEGYFSVLKKTSWVQRNATWLWLFGIIALSAVVIWMLEKKEQVKITDPEVSVVPAIFSDTTTKQVVTDPELTPAMVWRTIYPDKTNFDYQEQLIRTEYRSGQYRDYRTKLSDIYYYTFSRKDKAAVILLTYEYTNGEKEICHVCTPQMNIATFVKTEQGWELERFVENWENAAGSWGESAEIIMKVSKGVPTLTLHYTYGNQGEFIEYNDVYNLETLRKITSTSIKLSSSEDEETAISVPRAVMGQIRNESDNSLPLNSDGQSEFANRVLSVRTVNVPVAEEDGAIETGIVILDIVVDEKGRFVSGEYQPIGSTTESQKLVDIAVKKAGEFSYPKYPQGFKQQIKFNFQ